jgi:hypothetical protein
MRDFRDAKTMAHSLRDALNAKAVETTHSESLEFIAKAFGFDNLQHFVGQDRRGRAREFVRRRTGTSATKDTLLLLLR